MFKKLVDWLKSILGRKTKGTFWFTGKPKQSPKF